MHSCLLYSTEYGKQELQVKHYVFRIIKILGHFPKLLDHRFEVLSTRVTSPGAHLKQVIAGGFKVDIARLYGCRG